MLAEAPLPEAVGAHDDLLRSRTTHSRDECLDEIRVDAPYVSMVHDIALSQKHIVIPIYGLTSEQVRARSLAE